KKSGAKRCDVKRVSFLDQGCWMITSTYTTHGYTLLYDQHITVAVQSSATIHRHPSRIHQSCFSHPEHPTLKCFTQPWVPSHGAAPNHGGPSHNVHGCASDDLTAGHPTSDTICSEGRAWSPHPDSATPKSLAQWHGSQRAYSTVGTITRHT